MAVASPPRPRSRTPRLLKPLKRKVQFWLLVGLVIFMIAMAILVSIGGGPGVCGAGAAPSDTAQTTIPAELMPLYVSAEQQYGVPWSLLAAINSIESGFGTNMGPSSAGAMGPMQFMPATWSQYGVDGNGDGQKDIMDPEDAIPGAAKYLKASGAPAGPRARRLRLQPRWLVRDEGPHAGQDVRRSRRARRRRRLRRHRRAATPAPQAVLVAANALHAMRVPYNYGGGHITPARPGPGADGPFDGLDCSSSSSWVLQHAGIDVATLDSTSFMSWGDPGPGESVTLYTNPIHIIMSIKVGDELRFFGTSGFGHPEQGTGPAWFSRPVSAGYLAGFVARHPPGL